VTSPILEKPGFALRFGSFQSCQEVLFRHLSSRAAVEEGLRPPVQLKDGVFRGQEQEILSIGLKDPVFG
jgi:hypothetical protein